MTKRCIDIVVALIGLIVLGPLIGIIGLLVRCILGSPVLFRQHRPGRNGVPFVMNKFRTMTDARDAAGQLLANEQRLTRFGQFLRVTSLDELPELWNVLRGDMSLVGPRPLLIDYLEHYTPRQRRRHNVRPGITGWAQVHGRADLDWDQKIDLDVWYVEHAGLWLDLKIMWMTAGVVLTRRGTLAIDNGLPPPMQVPSGGRR